MSYEDWEFSTPDGRKVIVSVEAHRDLDFFNVGVSGVLLRDDTVDREFMYRCIDDALRQSARKETSRE